MVHLDPTLDQFRENVGSSCVDKKSPPAEPGDIARSHSYPLDASMFNPPFLNVQNRRVRVAIGNRDRAASGSALAVFACASSDASSYTYVGVPCVSATRFTSAGVKKRSVQPRASSQTTREASRRRDGGDRWR